MQLPTSTLAKNQKITHRTACNTAHGTMRVTIRYDDECNNGHNTFAITCSCSDGSGGCMHDEIVKVYPDLAPLIKWHLCSSDEPIHYIANTVYHAKQHGPQGAWIYWTDPLGFNKERELLLCYTTDPAKAAQAETDTTATGYRVQWDEKTAKTRNLDYARRSAIWPDATDEQLTSPNLPQLLQERLPALMQEFKAAMEGLGFTY